MASSKSVQNIQTFDLDAVAAKVTEALLFPMQCNDSSGEKWNMAETALKSIIIYIGENSAKEITITSTLDKSAEFSLYTAASCVNLSAAFESPRDLSSAVEDEILPVVKEVLLYEYQKGSLTVLSND